MPTHHHGPPEEIRALDAYIKLVRAFNSLANRLAPTLADSGLTEGQFGVLEALFHLGPLHQCDLARKHLQSGGNITMIVDNLEKADLVRRERSAVDRRYVQVHLTAEGRRLIKKLFPRHARAIADELGALTASEQEELARLCRKLGLGASAVPGGTRSLAGNHEPRLQVPGARPEIEGPAALLAMLASRPLASSGEDH